MSDPLTPGVELKPTTTWARCDERNRESRSKVAREIATSPDQVEKVTGNLEALATGKFGEVFLGVVGKTLLPVAVREFKLGEGEETDIQHYICVRHPLITQDYSTEKLTEVARYVLDSPKLTLQADIHIHVKYEEEQIKIVMYQLIRGLDYLHSQRVYHGTLNGKNIFIDHYSLVKISDVESNDYLKSIPYADVPLDDVQFIAPELANTDEKVSSACDIWSLGALLYLMVTGIFPFLGKTRDEIVNAMMNGKLGTLITGFNEIQELVDVMLNPDPSKRIKLQKLIDDEAFENDKIWPCLVPFHHYILDHSDQVTINGAIKRDNSHGSLDSIDFGYGSEPSAQLAVKEQESDSDHESDNLGDDEHSDSDDDLDRESEDEESLEESKTETTEAEAKLKPVESDGNIPKRYFVHLGVYAIENNREEWDPTFTILEKCRFPDGLPCLKIVIPPIREPSPPVDGEEVPQNDIEVGDYALLNFKREGTSLAKTTAPLHFDNRRQAADHFCREEAEKIWNQLNLKRCDRCVKAGTDAFRHDGENCIYDLLSKAVETDEIVSYNRDDIFNMRRYTLTYRTDGGRATRMKRLRRRARKVLTSMNSGVRWLKSKFRRSRPQN